MRTKRELEFEIEMLNREMCKLVIQQADIDERLKQMDRRVLHLQKELKALV